MKRTRPRRLFLERRTYRRNRLQDAARLLPVLGSSLIFTPVFIRGAPGEGPGIAGWLVYFLVIWLVLIGLTLLVSRAIARDHEQPAGTAPETPEDGDDADGTMGGSGARAP